MPKKLLLVAAAAAVIALGAQPAQGLTIDLTTGNTAISGYPDPYGTVTVTLSGQTATFTFTAADPAGSYAYLFGNGGIFGVNLNATSWSYTGPVGSGQPQTGAMAPAFTIDSPQQLDGFGTFNFSFDNFDGYLYAVKSITFTVTNLSGTWLSESDVLALNANGASVGAHIFIATVDGAGVWTNTKVTGYAAGGGENIAVPDGGLTASLLGLALAGMGLVARLKK